MANIKTLQRSFAGGEVTPELFGRIDDAKYQSGLAKCLNFIPKPQGPVENRAGFAFVRAVKDSTKKTRLINFTYSTTQTMVIEMGAGYFRFHTNGATLLFSGSPYEVASPYAEADLFDIHFVQSADVMTLVHPNYAPRELRRVGATDWQLTVISMAPNIAPPSAFLSAGTPTTHQYVVTAVFSDYGFLLTGHRIALIESVASSVVSCSNDLSQTGYYNTISWTAAPGATAYQVYKWNGAVYGYIGAANGSTSFKDDGRLAIVAGTNPPVSSTKPAPTGVVAAANSPGSGQVTATAFVPSGATNLWTQEYVVSCVSADGTESLASTKATCSNNIYVSGAYNTIAWPAVTGAESYNIYRLSSGMYGYLGQSRDLTFRDDNISPDMSKTPPITADPFIGAGNYPGAVSYFEQRRGFAGTLNQPQNIWMTKSGTESNMSYSLPIRDDDRISFRVAAREANTIRHIVPLTQLLLLTGAAEWRVTSVNSDAITPSTISVRPQSYVGSSNVQPVIINNTLIYGAARGGHVRELAYNWQANGFISGDLSLRAPHLFDTFDVVDMAYSKAPSPVVWFISTSGKLLGLTYVPEQQVGAWHQHDTDGVFESCTVVAEGAEDVLYVVVRRTINGSQVRYVERMASRQFATAADAFFVDSGLTYSGAPATAFSGLGHLEGKTVSILADGAVHPQKVVTSGSITLDNAASKVHIGLPITADIETLPVAAQIDNSFGQGRFKNVNKAWLRVYRSSGIFVGPNANQLREAKQRTTEAYGSPPALKSAEIPVMVDPSWADSGQVYIRQSDPLPLTIVNLTCEVALGG